MENRDRKELTLEKQAMTELNQACPSGKQAKEKTLTYGVRSAVETERACPNVSYNSYGIDHNEGTWDQVKIRMYRNPLKRGVSGNMSENEQKRATSADEREWRAETENHTSNRKNAKKECSEDEVVKRVLIMTKLWPSRWYLELWEIGKDRITVATET